MTPTQRIEPYVNPRLPPHAPAWARGWCSERRAMSPALYDVLFGLVLAARRAGLDEAMLDIATRYPWRALCLVACEHGRGCRICRGAGGIAVVLGHTLWRDAAAVLFCREPDVCDVPIEEHPSAPPEGVTLLGYRHGITPRVVHALSQGRPLGSVQVIAADPCAELH